jgi:hypothetical protein
MNKKNTIIIAIIIIVLIIVSVWIMIYSQKTTLVNNSTSPSGSSQTGTGINNGTPSNSGGGTPSFPVNNPPQNNNVNNGNSPYGNLTISNANDQSQTNKDIVNFISTPSTKNLTQVIDKNGQIIPLETFTSAMNFKINPDLNALLDNKDYQLVKCPESPNSFGVLLNIRLFPDRPNIYRETRAIMKNWESTIFQDTYPLLFPSANFNAESVASQKLSFRNDRYRNAEVTLPNGSKSSVNYDVVFDSIIITNSPSCLAKISALVETIEP